MKKILSLFALWAHHITMRSLFGSAFCSLFWKLILFSVLRINDLLFPSQDDCCDFWDPEQLEAPLLCCLERCPDFCAVIDNSAVVKMKQCLKWQHKPSALCSRCNHRLNCCRENKECYSFFVPDFFPDLFYEFSIYTRQIIPCDFMEPRCPMLPSITYIQFLISVCSLKPSQIKHTTLKIPLSQTLNSIGAVINSWAKF